VIGCTVISMENYRTGVDDGNDLDLIEFSLLVQNLEVCFIAFVLLTHEVEVMYLCGG
jgi:hypothetical protein